MSKQPTRGHVSVKGETYAAFKEACQEANIPMGRLLDKLIMAELDRISFAEDGQEPMGLIDIKTEIWEDTADYRVPRDEPTLNPEFVLASFHRCFGMPKPVASILPNEVEPTPQGEPGSIFVLDPPDPYHVEVKRNPPPGLFSEEGLRQAEAEPTPAPSPRSARGSSPPRINADDIPSYIDPTFGRK